MFHFMLFAHEQLLLKKAWESGVDRILIDWEIRGKAERQHGYHLEQNYLTKTDLISAREFFPGQIVCRINPIRKESEAEIADAIKYGADMIMLPMFKTVKEVDRFLELVNNKAKTILLLENREAVSIADGLKKKSLTRYILV